MGRENVNKLVTLVCKAVALAMGVAVIVLGALHGATAETRIMLLGIGLFGLALAALQQSDGDEALD